MARDELATVCLTQGYDEMIFWDIDCSHPDHKLMLSMFARLLSHDVDIVGLQYVGHNFLSHFHGAATAGAEPRSDGLLEMGQIPLGLSKIKRVVLERLRETHPYLLYSVKQTEDVAMRPGMFKYFPNGVVGPCTGQGKLQRIAEVLRDYRTHAANFAEYLDQIHAIVKDDRYETSYLLGEDFYFCKIAQEAGFKLYIDNNVIVPHETTVRLPVTNTELVKSLSEPWRWKDSVQESEALHAIEIMRSKLGGDHL